MYHLFPPYALTHGALSDMISELPGIYIAGMDILYPYEQTSDG